MKQASPEFRIIPEFCWSDIDTVLLDMDGTLLDKYFDDFFWEKFVPLTFAEKKGIAIAEAEAKLLAKYRSVESTLQWSDLNFWSDQLDLDIFELKCRIDHLINVHPYVVDFLKFARKIKKRICLITAAHPFSLGLKLKKTAIGHLFHEITCIDEVGLPKEDPRFWEELKKILYFDSSRTLFADDTEKVLLSAELHGIKELIYVARPSSRKPVAFSKKFPSIVYFNELIFQNLVSCPKDSS